MAAVRALHGRSAARSIALLGHNFGQTRSSPYCSPREKWRCPWQKCYPKPTWQVMPWENALLNEDFEQAEKIDLESTSSTNRPLKERGRVVVVFDKAYSEHGLAVYGAVHLLASQLGNVYSYEIFCACAYRGPKFSGPFRVTVSQPEHGLAALSAKVIGRIRRLLTSCWILESNERWESNLEQGEERLLERLIDADNILAVVVFSTDPSFALRISRWAHIFTSTEAPHLVVVTPNDRIDGRVSADLKWLGVNILRDGDLVVGRRQAATAEDGTTPVGEAIQSVFSFLPASEYPRQLTTPSKQIHWPTWIGRKLPHPARVRDIVLFLRPDWINCGSGTTFENLARWFRQRDALLIDVGIWPYRKNFDASGRADRVESEQRHIRAALYFSTRMSTSAQHFVRQFAGVFRRFPRTLARQKSFQHSLAAKPNLMRKAIRSAKITHIYLNHYFTYDYAREFIAGRPFFLDTHDVQTVNFIHYNQLNTLTRRVDRFDKSLRDEMEIAGKARKLCFVSEEEMDLAARFISREKLDYVLPLPQVSPCLEKSLETPARLLIVASNNPGNVQNLHWFLTHVWPAVLGLCGERPAPLLQICGGIDRAMPETRADGVHFVGVVPDLRPYYEECALVILPVIIGGGVAIKTLEAVLHGRPVLATRHALRGLPSSVVEAIGYEDDPFEFAKSLLEIVTNAAHYAEQTERSRRARELLVRHSFYDVLKCGVDSVRLPPQPPR